MSKVASQADLWYNKHTVLWRSRGVPAPLEQVTSSVLRRLVTMNTLPHDALEKQCTGECKRILPATSEYFEIARYNGKEWLRNECRDCRLKKAKARYHDPVKHEQILAQDKVYRERPEVKEQIRNAYKEWSESPEGKAYKQNYQRIYRERPEVLEKKRTQDKEYRERPEVRERRRPLERVWSSTRRARKKNVGGTYTPQQIQDLLKRQKHKCYYCGDLFEKQGRNYIYQIDHVVPLIRGGSNDISNLVLACPPCNQHKHDKLPHEWPEGGKLL